MEHLDLAEEEEFEYQEEREEQGAGSDLALCLVGRFLTDRSIRVTVMQDKMADIWRPGRGVNIREVEPGLFLFQFYHQLDIQRVLKQGPWSFDKHLLILGVVPEGSMPKEIELYKVPFWVQIHDLPIGFMSETVGRGLGNFIGEFLEYDMHNSSNFWRQYMRIRVLVDVRQPLRRGKKVRKQGGEARMVSFKYERLEVFCYLCGMLGHMEGSCDKLFSMVEDDGSRGWGPTLRAEQRRGGGGARSKWLRNDAQQEWKGPLQCINGTGNHGVNGLGNNNELNGERRSQGMNVIAGQRSGVDGIKSIDVNEKGIGGSVAEINVAAIFQNPIFPIKTHAPDASGSKQERNASGSKQEASECDKVDEPMIIDVDRKRQRNEENGNSIPHGDHVDNQHASMNSIVQPSVTNSETNTVDSFLSVGPGSQACREQ